MAALLSTDLEANRANRADQPASRRNTTERIALVIPTLNETEVVRELVDRLSYLRPWKLIFADSSTDGTKSLIENLSETHPYIELVPVKRRGLGVAIRRGLSVALSSGAGLVITMDADLSHPPSDVPRLLEASMRADIVIGSRYVSGGRILGWGPFRILMSRTANTVSRLLLRIPARDCSTNFRCYNRRALEKIIPLSLENGYAVQNEILFLADRLGFKIAEVPTTFVNRNSGKSKLGRREVFKFLAYLLRTLRKTEAYRLRLPLAKKAEDTVLGVP